VPTLSSRSRDDSVDAWNRGKRSTDVLKGKSAVVTGSTSGIGAGIAEALAREGVRVMINGFGDADRIEKQRRALERLSGAPALYDAADMTKPDQITAMIERAAATFGGVDILANNAGIQHTAPIHEFPAERWDAIIAINLSAAFHAIRAAVPYMHAAGWGRIVNTASVHGLVASVNKCAYIAAKHGLVGLTKTVALENAGRGITCNAFCPGWVRTDLVERQIVQRASELGVEVEEGARDLLREKQPSLQFVTVEQIAALVVFLCQDAADQISGAAIPIDGGWSAQ
jgi:3-hydroxybutyrate dehydrogenase